MNRLSIIELIIILAQVAILARIILSFVIPLLGNRPHPLVMQAAGAISQITEPFLGPIRRVLPTFGQIDFSPMVAILILMAIEYIAIWVLGG